MTYLTDEEVRKQFLEKFKCIDSGCDQTGTIPHQIGDDEWEAQQCQFCSEVRFPAADFILTLRKNDRETTVRAVIEKMRQIATTNRDSYGDERKAINENVLLFLEDCEQVADSLLETKTSV